MSRLRELELAPTPQLDAFGRLRASWPFTIFDSKQIHDALPLRWDDVEESGSGTSSTHSANEARSKLAVSLNTAGKRTRQTFMRFNYQPGKSQLIFCTFVLDEAGGGTGITRGVGYYDDDNGVFLLDDEGTVKLVRRTNVTGTPSDSDAVAQASWSEDTFGAGSKNPSGITLDWNKTQILCIDFEWLGVGIVKTGFVVEGIIYPAHQFKNANNLATVYMSTPNLPLRYQIENDGTGAASELDAICSTVMSEAGQEALGVIRYDSTAGTHIDLLTENTLYPVFGIRLKSGYLGTSVDLLELHLQEQAGNKSFEWEILLNPTLSAGLTYADITNGAVQTAKGDGTITVSTGNVKIGGGFGQSAAGNNRSGSATSPITSALRLGAAVDGTRDEIIIAVRPVGGSSAIDIECGLIWRELS